MRLRLEELLSDRLRRQMNVHLSQLVVNFETVLNTLLFSQSNHKGLIHNRCSFFFFEQQSEALMTVLQDKVTSEQAHSGWSQQAIYSLACESLFWFLIGWVLQSSHSFPDVT